jgi:predicted metal-dependent peptidase
MEKLAKRKLNPKDIWEYYYEQLKNEVENNPDYFSDHDKMDGDGMEWESDSDRAIDRATIRDKIGQATKASAGKIPEELSSFIASYNQPALVNWKQQLRNLISSARCTTTKPTMMKTHRRFDLDQPGRKKNRKLVLGVCTDSSGSISDESYSMFMNEIVSIAKNTTVTYLVHADCVVQKVDVIKGGKASGDVLKKRHGNGGTAYSPAIEECVKRKCDAIVYFGDFDCSDIPKNPGVPFIWVGVGNQSPPANFGRVIRI